MSGDVFVVGLGLAVLVVASRALAPRLHLPDAVPLVVLGVAASFLPGLPAVRLSPNVVFLVFLPPLVYHAGFFSAPRETRANALPIAVLAVGLVAATTAAVAAAAMAVIPGLGWPTAFVLGAVVAPTDPVAATAVVARLGAPARIATILEGEGLVNDGVALTIFALALQAQHSSFSVGYALGRFVEVSVGGLALGVVVGWLVARVRRRLADPGVQIVVSLVTPYLAYVPADRLSLSGVLAAVAAGVYLGTRSPGLFQPESRLAANAFWDVTVFLLESVLFLLLGLQFRSILQGIAGLAATTVALDVGVVATVVVAGRLAWELALPPLASRVRRLRTEDFTSTPWQHRLVIGWSGIRGAISFAAALSIPVTAGAGSFPHRPLLLFVTIVVVLVTLVGQGTTLGPLLRAVGLAESDRERREETLARRAVAEAALSRIEELVADERLEELTAAALRQVYELRLDRLADHDAPGDAGSVSSGRRSRLPDTVEIRLELIGSQRSAVQRLYREARIGADTRRALARDLDLEESRLRRRS